MERNKYLKMCQEASYKTACTGVWWAVNWNPEELVSFEGTAYVPVDYRFGFRAGTPTHIAIIHDTKANTEYNVPLEELTEYRED